MNNCRGGTPHVPAGLRYMADIVKGEKKYLTLEFRDVLIWLGMLNIFEHLQHLLLTNLSGAVGNVKCL